MKRIYTQFISGVLTLMVGILCVSSASAQYTITTAAGEQFQLFLGDPGQFSGLATTGTIELASSSCDAMTNTAGSILIADLGTCSAARTAELANDAEAIAVIVCGIDVTTTNLTFETDVDGNVIAGSDLNNMAVFAMGTDCADLKVSAGSEATLELLVTECMPMVPDNVVWGANGEGEFNGGLGDWTIDNDNGFAWDPKGKLDKGAYSGPAQILSPSLCNGAVVADASFGDNEGEPGNFLNGNCPSDGNVFCETELTSPVIDLSAVEFDGLFLQFFQAVRQFNSEYNLIVSVDGGETFRDPIPFNAGLETNSNHIQDIISIPLLNIPQDAQLQFTLQYRGYYYYFGVDDFYLVNRQIGDVRLNTDAGNFFASHAINYETPNTQSDIIPLLVDVENVGNLEAAGVSVSAALLNEAGVTLEEASLDYGMITPGFVDQNRLFDDVFQMPTENGTYRIVYTLNFAEDENVDNNSYTSTFRIGDNVFSKCEAVDATARIAFPDTPFYSLGAAYHVSNSTDADGNQLYITNLRVGISGNAADAVSGSVGVSVYEWNDLDIDSNVDADDGVGLPERALIYETSILVFGADATLEDRVISLLDEGVELPLKDDQNYLVVLHSMPLNADTDQYRFMAADSGANPDYNFGATAFAFGRGSIDGNIPDPDDPTMTTLGTITENPLELGRMGTIGGTGSSADDNDTRLLFQVNNFAALAEMHIGRLDVSTEDINEDIAVSVYPNPAVNNVFVDLALENVSDNVNLQVVDIQGKVVMTQNFANVKADKLQLNVADLNTGVYVINIRTEEGFTSARFIKD